MQTTISLTQTRAQLPQLIKDISLTEVLISVKGKVEATLVDAGEYQNMQETLAILSDNSTMKAIENSLAEIKRGEVVDWQDIRNKYVSDQAK